MGRSDMGRGRDVSYPEGGGGRKKVLPWTREDGLDVCRVSGNVRPLRVRPSRVGRPSGSAMNPVLQVLYYVPSEREDSGEGDGPCPRQESRCGTRLTGLTRAPGVPR